MLNSHIKIRLYMSITITSKLEVYYLFFFFPSRADTKLELWHQSLYSICTVLK